MTPRRTLATANFKRAHFQDALVIISSRDSKN